MNLYCPHTWKQGCSRKNTHEKNERCDWEIYVETVFITSFTKKFYEKI